jgi:hypothetical protein
MGLAELTTPLQRQLFGVAVADLRQLISDSRNELADLRVTLNRLESELRKLREEVDAAKLGARERPIEDLSLDEVLALHKGCHDALERFEIHGAGARSLREAAAAAGADLHTIVATIKNLLTDQAA